MERIIEMLISNNKIEFIIDSEWIIRRLDEKVSIEHTYHFKGEQFSNINEAIKHLKKKLQYMVKRGYSLNVEVI